MNARTQTYSDIVCPPQLALTFFSLLLSSCRPPPPFSLHFRLAFLVTNLVSYFASSLIFLFKPVNSLQCDISEGDSYALIFNYRT